MLDEVKIKRYDKKRKTFRARCKEYRKNKLFDDSLMGFRWASVKICHGKSWTNRV
jgi:hypothetical protein